MEVNESSGRIAEVLPSPEILEAARRKLTTSLPEVGIGLAATEKHLQQDIVPSLSASSRSANYYGFVTGGVSPAAAFADRLVSEHDQNVSVHLPQDSIATNVEDRALSMVCEILRLDPKTWAHRIFTTGATASNLVGLACGREFVLQTASARIQTSTSVAEDGLAGAMVKAGIERVQVLTTVPHSSLRKAASIIGLGRASVIDVGRKEASHKFDFDLLERHLSTSRSASIVAVSFSEVNTGLFATTGAEMIKLRQLCDSYDAWLHVDAAFGLMARLLHDDKEFSRIRDGVAGLELADSITGDAHKLFNVPYDCGIFLSKRLDIGTEVFQNPNAAYLKSGGDGDGIPSPLNIGIENSRRFRALPVYASLTAYGAKGFREMLEGQIRLSREIAKVVAESDHYELLPQSTYDLSAERLQDIYVIVLFRAKDAAINEDLVARLNGTRRLYVSGTQWEGRPAARFAVSNWQVNIERDIALIKEVLEEAIGR